MKKEVLKFMNVQGNGSTGHKSHLRNVFHEIESMGTMASNNSSLSQHTIQ